MSAAEVERFRSSPHAESAVTLRRCDDAAKVPELVVPELEDYLPWIEQVAVEAHLHRRSRSDVPRQAIAVLPPQCDDSDIPAAEEQGGICSPLGLAIAPCYLPQWAVSPP